MKGYKFSQHAKQMMAQRNIKDVWIEDALLNPDSVLENIDGTTHYIKKITENNNKFLRIIVNKEIMPGTIVTLFFDRRITI